MQSKNRNRRHFLRSFGEATFTSTSASSATLSVLGTALSIDQNSSMPLTLGFTAAVSTLCTLGGIINSSDNDNPSISGKISGGATGIFLGAGITALSATGAIILDEKLANIPPKHHNEIIVDIEEPNIPASYTFG